MAVGVVTVRVGGFQVRGDVGLPLGEEGAQFILQARDAPVGRFERQVARHQHMHLNPPDIVGLPVAELVETVPHPAHRGLQAANEASEASGLAWSRVR